MPLPSVAITFFVTFLFGPFGIVPATVHCAQAEQRGEPGNQYWVAFILGMMLWLVVAVAILVSMQTATQGV